LGLNIVEEVNNSRSCNDHYHPSHLKETVQRFVLVTVPHVMGFRMHETIPPLCVYDTYLTSVSLSHIGYM
jgi:hypothetical protein